MKKISIVLTIMVIASLLSSCGSYKIVSTETKYVGEKGKTTVWVCPDGNEVTFDKNVSSDVAAFKCAVKSTATPAIESQDCESQVIQENPCLTKAKYYGFPSELADYVCSAPQNNSAPVERMKSGSQISFGTITFDSETRVWVLQNFEVPAKANYAFDYLGREQNVFDAPFMNGEELSPVDGRPFKVCFDTTSNGCKPPAKIEFTN